MVLSAAKSYPFEKLANALRKLWEEDDIRENDSKSKTAGEAAVYLAAREDAET